MYRLLGLDLDDTLVNGQREISQRNKDAIQAAIDKGVIVTFLTGRAYGITRKVCEEMKLGNMPVVCFGGAKIIRYPDDTVLHQELLTPDMAREVLAFAEREGVYAQVYDGDIFCYNVNGEEAQFYATRMGYSGRLIDFTTAPLDNTAKVLLTVQPDQMSALFEKAKRELGHKYQITPSTNRFLEFYMPGTDKGAGLAWLGQHFGIPREEMIAMGDTGIDAPMLRYAGLGVAVSNAMKEAKEAADLITVSADEDAVAKIIEEYIL